MQISSECQSIDFSSLPELKRAVPSPRPLASLLADAAGKYGEMVYLSFKEHRWTYDQAWSLVRRISDGLARLGVEPGSRVGICLVNTPHYALICFALWRLGAAGVGMNPLYSLRQLNLIASDSEVGWVVVSDDNESLEKGRKIAEETGARLIVCRADAADLAEIHRATDVQLATGEGREVSFAALLDAEAVDELKRPSPDALAMIQYTGGTTGAPKGAMLTHANIWSGAHQILYWLHRIENGKEAWYAAAPFSHITGLLNYIVEPTIVGGESILAERFSARHLLDLVRARRVTVLTAIPTMLSAVLAEQETSQLDWSGIVHVLVGGAPVPPELARRFQEATGLVPQQGYAMTETSGSGVGMPNSRLAGHEGATGIPMGGTRVEVRSLVDPDKRVEAGEQGEVCFSGANVISGYWRRPLTPDELTSDGFFRSGDIGSLSRDGVLYVVDRLKDVIICSGYNVYPRVVEDAVLEHPSIAETVAIGLPDEYRGETVLCVAALRPGESLSLPELQDFLEGKLSPIEMPKRLEILEALPKTENAKLSRRAIRAIFHDVK